MIESSHNNDIFPQPKIFIAAGEVSGDRQAALLAKTMRKQQPGIFLYGSGGEKMREAGIDIRIQTSHFGSVGFQESLRYFRPLRSIMSELRTMISIDPPDLALLVDNEGFNGILAKYFYKIGIPFIYYFPPQVWLWGEWRAKAISKRARTIITAFPDEAQIYRREGGHVEWFGHPLLDIVKPEGSDGEIFRDLSLDSRRPMIAVMPGSRFQELEQLAAPMFTAARSILARHPEYQIIVPLAASHLLPMLRREIDRAGMAGSITIITQHVYACLSRCTLVMLSSGTATLEVALLGVPMVVGYRVKPLTFFLGKHLVKSRFIAMPNILLDEPVIPELLQDDVNAARLSAEALAIIENPDRIRSIKHNLGKIRPLLGSEGVLDRAAALILREACTAQSTVQLHEDILSH